MYLIRCKINQTLKSIIEVFMLNSNIVRTRFAPSPTGFMHVGNLRTALYAWLLARSQGGKFILRIEDTDQARYVENAVEVIYATLAAANLTHDEGPDVGGDFGPYVQSERKHLYKDFAIELVNRGAAYYCFCEKQDDDETTNDNAEDKKFIEGCPSQCGNLSAEEVEEKLAKNTPYVIRQKIKRDGSVTTFVDAVYGEVSIENKVLDDQILLKQDGMPTYNFANVIDDHLMQITHVVRGSEYLSSTPKYNLLYQAFGWEVPTYVHLPLIMGRDSEGNVSKLSKRHGSVSFENLVSEGYLPSAIMNYVALLGWSPKSDRELFTLSELAEAFNVNGLNKAAAIFDYAKLRWMNSEYIKQLTSEDFADIAKKFANISGSKLENQWGKIAALLQQRTEVLSDIPNMIDFLFEKPEFNAELFNHKKSKSSPETAKQAISDFLQIIDNLKSFDADSINNSIMEYAAKNELKIGQPMWGIRIGVAGKSVTPGGPGEIMEILGKAESISRLQDTLAKL